jgi:hypothetical protein
VLRLYAPQAFTEAARHYIRTTEFDALALDAGAPSGPGQEDG